MTYPTVHLETPRGPVYVALGDTPPPGLDGPVLTRGEVDALLEVVSRVAPPGYLKRTLWTELHALVELKRWLHDGGPGAATYLQPGEMRGVTVSVPPTEVPDPPAPEPEQLGLL